MNLRGLLRLACVVASVSPVAVQAAASVSYDAPGFAAAMATTPWRVAQATTNTSSTQSTTDAASESQGTVVKPRRHKKTVARQQQDQQPPQRSGAAIVKEGGKTCSGLDEYRVCW